MGSHFSASMLAVRVIFLSVFACAHTRAAAYREGIAQDKPDPFRRHTVHLAPAMIHQPRGLIWDWLVGGSNGGTTPRPAQRPGDRQDESSTEELTGTWILGYPARRLHLVPNRIPGIINGYPQGSNGVLYPWWPAVYHHVQK